MLLVWESVNRESESDTGSRGKDYEGTLSLFSNISQNYIKLG